MDYTPCPHCGARPSGTWPATHREGCPARAQQVGTKEYLEAQKALREKKEAA
jgi:endogenous inhibitor of DNA gyrase (YacG/DUF329 family)